MASNSAAIMSNITVPDGQRERRRTSDMICVENQVRDIEKLIKEARAP